MFYYNIHTHRALGKNRIHELISVFDQFDQLPDAKHLSIGFHPRYLNGIATEHSFGMLSQLAASNQIAAIGECGLDKKCNEDFELQKYWFQKQITLANEVDKPLVIHCVGAYEEVLSMLKLAQSKVPVIFHGFNKSRDLMERIIQEGYYISIGKAIFIQEKREVFKHLNISHLLMETDAADLHIEDIYKSVSEVMLISMDSLKEQVELNINRIFNHRIW